MSTYASPRSCSPWSIHCAWENSRLSWKLILSRKLGLKEEGTLQVGDRAIYSCLAARRCGSDGGVVGPSQGHPWVGTSTAYGSSKTGTGISGGSRQNPMMG